MPHFYLGQTTDGRIVSRKSTNPEFTHAAMMPADSRAWCLPSFSTSSGGAVRNFEGTHGKSARCEIVELRKVDGKEFRAATKGINPRTGRPASK